MSVFLVTGASRGLGREVVRAALAAGHNVVAGARNPHALENLDAGAGRLVSVPLDVTDAAAAEAAVRTAVDRFGRLDVLVNNAEYANVASIEDVDLEDFRAQVDANLFGVVHLTRAVLPVMREQGGGHVVQVSSVGARVTAPGLGAYQAAKWAVGGFSSVLAAEVAPLGIRVTVLEPGGMRTDWAGSSMRIAAIRPPYEATVGEMVRRVEKGGATNANDPAKVAQVVLQVAAMDAPPMRLLLGEDAFVYGTAAVRALLAEDERWEELSRSTTADDATADDIDPLRQAARS